MYHFFAIASKQKLDSVKDVTLAAAIESCDGIKLRVEATNLSAVLICFESLQDNLSNVHPI